MMNSASFGTVDFVVFSSSMAISMMVGLYYAIKDRKKESMDNYYFGEKKMSPLPVGLSIAVTFISAISLIAYPAEVYSFGNVIVWFVFVSIIPITLSCIFYVPLFMRLKVSSMFEYLERRFNGRIRKIASFITSFQMMFYIAMAIYAPSLALSAVTPLKLSITVILTSLLCTIYTSLGGMKAVVWTDTLQAFIILAGSLTATVKSLIVVGGFKNVWNALERGGRNNAFNFNPDPTIRTTFFTIIFGCVASWSSPHQAVVQRWISCGSVAKARLSSIISIFPTAIVTLICVINGCVMYAYYETCDPVKSGKVEKSDQMMPYMVLDIFQDLPGFAGLFVAAAFSGTLSTVSSGINSVSALIIEDFVLPFRPNLSQSNQVKISKGLVFLLGVTATGFALLVGNINRTIMQIGYTLTGMLVGPLTGIFVLGMLLPWANVKGAVIGQIIGTAITGWIAFGGMFYGDSANESLPTFTQGCETANSTGFFTTSPTFTKPIPTTATRTTLSNTLYSVSFLYYSAISLIVTVSSGLIGSLITGANKPSEADPILFVPIISNPIFPARLRNFFRFGVPRLQSKEKRRKKMTEMKLIDE